MDQILGFPSPDNLVASPDGSTIAWTFNERGARNIYVAEAPEFDPRRITAYQEDDGQELTNLSFSSDGKTIVYVRGGDHGSNWPAEARRIQPGGHAAEDAGLVDRDRRWRAPKLLGEGDEPVVAPDGDRVAFVKDRRIWIAPLDGWKPAEQAFFARGTSESPAWSPDGRTLAFVSNRDDHSFIGIFTRQAADSLSCAFNVARFGARMVGGRTPDRVHAPARRGGAPRSPLHGQSRRRGRFWLPTAPSCTVRALRVTAVRSGDSLVDRFLRTPAGSTSTGRPTIALSSVSYQDGWPHLYSIRRPGDGGKPTLLTPGPFMVEQVDDHPRRTFVVYSANTGSDRHDVDRRHLFKVPVNGGAPDRADVRHGDRVESGRRRATGRRSRFSHPMRSARRSRRRAARRRTERRACGRSRARGVPRGAARHARTGDVPGERRRGDPRRNCSSRPVATRASRRSSTFTAAAAADAARMALHGLLRERLRRESVPREPWLHRAVGQLPARHRLRSRVSFPGARGRARCVRVPRRAAAGRYLQARPDVDPKRIGIWGGSYGGYLTALALGRNSDVFAAGVDIHGVHDRVPAVRDPTAQRLVGDGLTEADLRQALNVAFESSPISAVKTWKSPVLLIHADDDRNVEFHQTVDLKRRLLEKGVNVEELVLPDDIHDSLLWRNWRTSSRRCRSSSSEPCRQGRLATRAGRAGMACPARPAPPALFDWRPAFDFLEEIFDNDDAVVASRTGRLVLTIETAGCQARHL